MNLNGESPVLMMLAPAGSSLSNSDKKPACTESGTNTKLPRYDAPCGDRGNPKCIESGARSEDSRHANPHTGIEKSPQIRLRVEMNGSRGREVWEQHCRT